MSISEKDHDDAHRREISTPPTVSVAAGPFVITTSSSPLKAANDAGAAVITPSTSSIETVDDSLGSPSFPFEDSEIIGLSKADIIEACKTAPILVAAEVDSRSIVLLSENTLVKFGWSIQIGEAKNMEFVHENAPSIRLPKVIRSFQDFDRKYVFGIGTITYIVMEHVPGTVLSACWENMSEDRRHHMCDQVVDVISTLQSHHLDRPGPVGGGICKDPTGLLFTKEGTSTSSLNSIGELERWYDHKLGWCKKYRRVHPDSPSFAGTFGDTVVMSHLDIGMRNIIVQEDDTICVLDWEMAGAYPSHFERFVLERQKISDLDFSNRILDQLPEDREKLDQQASVRWAISSTSFPITSESGF